MDDEKQCEHCVHFRRRLVCGGEGVGWYGRSYCALERPLEPCEYFEREPGSDDDE